MRYCLQITKALAQDDLSVVIEPSNDIEALDIIRDLKDSADDGWRMIPMRQGAVSAEEDIENYTLRDGSKAKLHTRLQSSGSVTQYDTIAEAVTAIDALGASDGFLLIDEGADSRVIYERPSLWISGDDIDDTAKNKRVNSHGRSEADRI